VLEAAGTKWNFLPFRPGLVGGHCLGVDPYYLTHKAQEIGYHPEVILAGRRINDNMGSYVAGQVVRLMSQAHLRVCDARVLVLGLAFKENCPDLRNTRVIDLIRELQAYRVTVEVCDPWIDPAQAQQAYGIAPLAEPPAGVYDAVVLAVAHRQFRELGAAGVRAFGKPGSVLYDVKHVLPASAVDGRL
jgi:UDP-N-acetyl-D-galactosamine dehydrogenase